MIVYKSRRLEVASWLYTRAEDYHGCTQECLVALWLYKSRRLEVASWLYRRVEDYHDCIQE